VTRELADAEILAVRGRAATRAGNEERARALLEELAALEIRKGPLRGWGLPFAWDAFADGSTNPVDTIYAYTTALAGLAYWEAFEAFEELDYFERAWHSAYALQLFTVRDGRVAWTWYSDADVDRDERKIVLNIAALSLELFWKLEEADSFRPALLELLVRDRAWRRHGGWSYAAGQPGAGDVFHDCLILLGLHAAGERGLARAGFGELLDAHFPDGRPAATLAARGVYEWGPPMALFTALELELDPAADRLPALVGYVRNPPYPLEVSAADEEELLEAGRAIGCRYAWRDLALATLGREVRHKT